MPPVNRNASFEARNPLMTRDACREATFERDRNSCVLCSISGVPLYAHHILERRLWDDGGYYLANMATVCEPCHLACEQTDVSVEDVRIAAGIRDIVVPDSMYPDHSYDKWGNPVLENGQRGIGPLFYDESVQKILAGKHDLFTAGRVKYPRTWHLPWSLGSTSDDKMIKDPGALFDGKRVIVTEKADGECTTIYRDGLHARSIDGRSHPTRDWVKTFASQWQHELPEGWRVCGENLFAVHSIAYRNLPSFFLGFSIWNDRNQALSWDETTELFELLGITPVKVLYDGIYDPEIIQKLWKPSDWDTSEGYVVRTAEGFEYGDFRKSVAKFVRPNHVQSSGHWMHRPVTEKNHLQTEN